MTCLLFKYVQLNSMMVLLSLVSKFLAYLVIVGEDVTEYSIVAGAIVLVH